MQGGIHGDRVARMDAGALKVLHDTRDQDVFAVADGVDLDLAAHHILIDQHRVLNLMAGDDLHIFPDILLTVGNLHAWPPKT